MPDKPNSFEDILALLWASEHEQDFEKLIARVDSERAPSNYTQKTNEELIIAAGVFRLCRWEIVLRIVIEKLDLPWDQANERAIKVAGGFGSAQLAWLYFLHPDEGLICFFIGVNLELAEVSREMASRTGQQPLRRSLMRFQENDSSSIEDLLVAVEKTAAKWGNPKLFHPYRRADETEDRKQTARLKIRETYVKMGEAGFNKLKGRFAVPVPRVTKLPLSQKNEKVLDRIRVATLEEDIAQMARSILPVLNGEEIPERAYQSVRSEDKLIAQKQARKEVSSNDPSADESLDRYMIERRLGVWKQDEGRLETLEDMGLVKPEDQPAIISLPLRRACRTVIDRRRTKRTKEAARVFLDELKDHGNKADATRAAK